MTIDPSLDANCALLDQGLDLLSRLADGQYAARRGSWAPVGAQYRHVLEHYHCFLAGLPAGGVDYDSRRRDAELEESPRRAADATRMVQAGLRGLAGSDPACPLRVQLRTSLGTDEPEWSDSTLGRELQFLVSHTVHHFALIKLLLDPEPIELDAEFGVAPSTLAHSRVKSGCAR